MPSILSLLDHLTLAQRRAVESPHGDLVLTAGAGSGKTLTLAGRYVSLLESGLRPEEVVAITFTDKAAREMRLKIRSHIEQWLQQTTDPTEQRRWQEIYTELDAAPIGTIHSLCARLLRRFPAEAGVDPKFEVLDEASAATLQAQAVEEALAWAADDPDAARLFEAFSEQEIRLLVLELLAQWQDACRSFAVAGTDLVAHWRAAVLGHLTAFLELPEVRRAVESLRDLEAQVARARQADDLLAKAITGLLAHWQAARRAIQQGDVVTAIARLSAGRCTMKARLGRQANWPDVELPRQAMHQLRLAYDDHLAFLGNPVDWRLDEQAAELVPPLQALAQRAAEVYRRAKSRLRALDFDDLEAGALELITSHPPVRAECRSQVRAVLVDEFQDTNDRQRQLVLQLVGHPAAASGGQRGASEPRSRSQAGRPASVPGAAGGPLVNRPPRPSLFVVGDAKQSIYRFRGADVTVFRRLQADIQAAGGRVDTLQVTFRAHRRLVAQLNALLKEAMALADEDLPFAVPFAPLVAHRSEPRTGVSPPYLQLCLGLADSADEGRIAAGWLTAEHLRRLHDEGGLAWSEMALLFRAATGFPPYEDALEAAGIPYVTVAGTGFADRPEVRDLVNALRAIADPTDDASLVGLLRSPAFGLTDAAIYLLRCDENGSCRPVWAALQGQLTALAALNPDDYHRARRARSIIGELHQLSGRVPVAELLKRFLDETDYRAILSAAAAWGVTTGAERARRNVSKLLADAHASGLVSVGTFLEYLQARRDVAAREGEAPAEAGEAVQLMTIHKAKGLQFPVVVIADAGRKPGGQGRRLWLDQDLGPVLDIRPESLSASVPASGADEKARPVCCRLAGAEDSRREEAEELRLIYVAATRACDQLVVSGHVKPRGKAAPRGLKLDGWLKRLGPVLGLEELPEDWPAEDLTPAGDPPAPAAERAGPATGANQAGANWLRSGGQPLAIQLPPLGGQAVGCLVAVGIPPAEPSPPPAAADSRPAFPPAAEQAPDDEVERTAAGGHSSERAPARPSDLDGRAQRLPWRSPSFRDECPLVAPPSSAQTGAEDSTDEKERLRPERGWRVVPTGGAPAGPARVIGRLVHHALGGWCFPGDEGYAALLRGRALEEGLFDRHQLLATEEAVTRLLRRFQAHPLYAILDQEAAERHHEVPYCLPSSGDRGPHSGVIDLLYRRHDRWHVVDFKTDHITDEEQFRRELGEHARQLRRYAHAVSTLLGERPQVAVCFLDAWGEVRVEQV